MQQNRNDAGALEFAFSLKFLRTFDWIFTSLICTINRLRSIYQYSSVGPRLSGQNCKFFMFLLSLNSQRRFGYKENNIKWRSSTWKPQSHVRILIYRTWPIPKVDPKIISPYFYDPHALLRKLAMRIRLQHLRGCITFSSCTIKSCLL